jgi:hypothetical protein
VAIDFLSPNASGTLKDAEIINLKRKVVQLERARAELSSKAQADSRVAQLQVTQITRAAQQAAKANAERIKVRQPRSCASSTATLSVGCNRQPRTCRGFAYLQQELPAPQ